MTISIPPPPLSPDEHDKVRRCRSYLERRGYFVGERLMTTGELADYLDISSAHLVKLPIAHINVGISLRKARRRYRLVDVQAWLQQQADSPAHNPSTDNP